MTRYCRLQRLRPFLDDDDADGEEEHEKENGAHDGHFGYWVSPSCKYYHWCFLLIVAYAHAVVLS